LKGIGSGIGGTGSGIGGTGSGILVTGSKIGGAGSGILGTGSKIGGTGSGILVTRRAGYKGTLLFPFTFVLEFHSTLQNPLLRTDNVRGHQSRSFYQIHSFFL